MEVQGLVFIVNEDECGELVRLRGLDWGGLRKYFVGGSLFKVKWFEVEGCLFANWAPFKH